jgi:hypothetical protein
MKKLLTILGILAVSMLSLTANAQLTVNQAVVTAAPYKVGDTIQIKYTVAKGTTKPRYYWLRYQFNNKALAYVSTTWSQGSAVQTYYTSWSSYKFTASTANSIVATSLYAQYLATPWSYVSNSDWNIGQLTVQRTDASVDGIIATQKYVIKDLADYTDIHKLDLSYAIDDTSAYIAPITTTTGKVSLSSVSGNTSQFKVRVLFPSNYSIGDHSVQLMKLKTDGSGGIDWTQQPIQTKALDASGEAIFTSGIKVGDSLGVFIAPAMTKTWMNNIITVSDAYKAFLGHTQTDITGASTYFTRPVLEKRIGLITLSNSTFGESDGYYLFAHVMGIDVTSKASVPKSTSTSVRYYSGLLNQTWLDGGQTNKVTIATPIQTVDAVFAWGGDLDWSHSSHPDTIASRISSGNYYNSINPGETIRTASFASMAYATEALEKATLSLTSTVENNKVTLSASLTKADLAGLEVIMQYDSTKLTLTDVIFDAGSTVTNFSTHDNGRLTFGSIDQLKTARIKVGTPYKLIFTSKSPLSNTAGLFYTVLADAVDATGKKIELIVE